MREILRLPPGRIGRVWRHGSGYLHFWHHHDEPELNIVLTGTARYLLSDRRYDLGPGSLAWLFPKQEHLLVDLSPDYTSWIAVVRPGALRRAARGEAFAGLRALDPAGRFSRRLRRDDLAFLDRLCADLQRPGDDEVVNAALPYLFLAAWERFARAPDVAIDQVLHPAVERAAARLAADPSAALDSVAADAGLSPSRLSRLFHAQVGQTLVAYRLRSRVDRFAVLRRRHPERSLLALALAAGFGSYAQFHRAVRQVVGVSPRDWDPDAPGPEAPAA